MANHFPDPPATSSMALSGVVYSCTINEPGQSALATQYGSNPDFSFSGTELWNVGPVYEIQLNTPGQWGSFDQDTFEGQLAALLNATAALVAADAGVTLTEAQGWITVNRMWEWTINGVGAFTTTESMPYPAGGGS